MTPRKEQGANLRKKQMQRSRHPCLRRASATKAPVITDGLSRNECRTENAYGPVQNNTDCHFLHLTQLPCTIRTEQQPAQSTKRKPEPFNPNRSSDTPGPFPMGRMRLSGILPASVRILLLATPRPLSARREACCMTQAGNLPKV